MGCLKKKIKKLILKIRKNPKEFAIGKSNHVFYINGMKENKKTHENQLTIAIWLYFFRSVIQQTQNKTQKATSLL